MDKLIAKAETATDEMLITAGLAIDGSTVTEAKMVKAAAIEVLVNRHPELVAVLDKWEMDLDTELTMMEVIALELA